MQGKMAISLILFLFPSLTVPVLAVFFLRGIPGSAGTFFSDYSAALIWGSYLVLLIAWIIFYRLLRAAAQREATPTRTTESAQQEA